MAKDGWKVVYVSTEETGEGEAEQLFDDEPATYWHSQWKDAVRPFPHRVIIDLGEIQTVSGIGLRQRGGGQPGCVERFSIYGRPQFFLFRKGGE